MCQLSQLAIFSSVFFSLVLLSNGQHHFKNRAVSAHRHVLKEYRSEIGVIAGIGVTSERHERATDACHYLQIEGRLDSNLVPAHFEIDLVRPLYGLLEDCGD